MAVPVLAIAAASAVVVLLVRAGHDPALNQGNPSTWSALLDVVARRQYAVAPLWPRQAPLWLQVGNLFEYADWQFALGLAPSPPPGHGPHRYAFQVFALGVRPVFAYPPGRSKLLSVIRPHLLAQGRLIGTYERG